MITVDRIKQHDGEYAYTLNVGTQDPFNHVNGILVTLNQHEAHDLHQALTSALGLRPETCGQARQPRVTTT